MVRGWRGTPIQRFERKFVRTLDNGCWVWHGAKSKKGYGSFSYEGKTRGAHRVSWMIYRGPIPDDLQIDHLCRNRACVNPDHLELVTPYENFLRGTKGSAGGRINKLKTHCPRGHPYDEANTIVYKGMRFCRQCHNERRRK